MGWWDFGALVYRTRCDAKTGDLVRGGVEVRIPPLTKGSGLKRSTTPDGHVEPILISEVEADLATTHSGSESCVCIAVIFTELSPCTGTHNCALLLNSDRVKKLHNTEAKFTVYYLAEWMADDKNGERIVKAYADLGIPLT
jgi:hypothetical protein